MEFKSVEISDKEIFDKYLRVFRPETSELSFTNIFMWRNSYGFKFSVFEDYLILISVSQKSKPYSFIPIGKGGNLKRVVGILKDYFHENGWELVFNRVDEISLESIKCFVQNENDIIYDRNNSDYIYNADDLAELKGKKFHSKRNHLHNFFKNYDYEYLELDSQITSHCYGIMDKWCSERSCAEHEEFYCEKLANTELLKNFDNLSCKGAMIKVNGNFEGFTVGEMLNEHTAVIHIEKANSQIHGLYPLINQMFCKYGLKEASFINREQDLGIEGLRKSKLSYNPVKLVNKYTVIIR